MESSCLQWGYSRDYTWEGVVVTYVSCGICFAIFEQLFTIVPGKMDAPPGWDAGANAMITRAGLATMSHLWHVAQHLPSAYAALKKAAVTYFKTGVPNKSWVTDPYARATARGRKARGPTVFGEFYRNMPKRGYKKGALRLYKSPKLYPPEYKRVTVEYLHRNEPSESAAGNGVGYVHVGANDPQNPTHRTDSYYPRGWKAYSVDYDQFIVLGCRVEFWIWSNITTQHLCAIVKDDNITAEATTVHADMLKFNRYPDVMYKGTMRTIPTEGAQEKAVYISAVMHMPREFHASSVADYVSDDARWTDIGSIPTQNPHLTLIHMPTDEAQHTAGFRYDMRVRWDVILAGRDSHALTASAS